MNIETTIIAFLTAKAVSAPTGFTIYGRRIPGNENLWPCAMVVVTPGGDYDSASGEHTATFEVICFGETVTERDQAYQAIKALDGFAGNAGSALGITVCSLDEIEPCNAIEYTIAQDSAWDGVRSTWRIIFY
jgi:hypothetical protein